MLTIAAFILIALVGFDILAWERTHRRASNDLKRIKKAIVDVSEILTSHRDQINSITMILNAHSKTLMETTHNERDHTR